MGCWIYGRWNSPLASAKTRTIVTIIALLTIAGGIFTGWPNQKIRLEWGTWSETTVEELRRSDKPVYIDFTAKWCATCQINKRVYKNKRLQALFKEKRVELLIADWTNEGPKIQKAINDLGKVAIPVNVLYIPGEDEPIILPELLTLKNVTEALNRISG
jgi:thiol:disulfide interchange protein